VSTAVGPLAPTSPSGELRGASHARATHAPLPPPPPPTGAQVNLSILYSALSPPARILDPDENWDTQRYRTPPQPLAMRLLVAASASSLVLLRCLFHSVLWCLVLSLCRIVSFKAEIRCYHTAFRLFDRLKSELQQEQDMMQAGSK